MPALSCCLRLPLPSLTSLALVATLATSPSVQAFDSPSLRLSGFGTLGVAHAHVDGPWSFRRDVLQRTTGRGLQTQVDSRLGLQGNLRLPHQWEAVLQGIAKPLARNAPLSQHLEWGFLAHQPAPGLTLRFGRVSTDMFLESEYRNVGFAMPWIRSNMEFYGWSPLPSLDGADIAQRWQSGDARWRAKLAIGQSDLDVPWYGGRSIGFQARDALAASVSREEGGLLVKLSFVQMKIAFTGVDELSAVAAGLRAVEHNPLAPERMRVEARSLADGMMIGSVMSRYATLSLQHTAGPWLTQFEANRGYSSGGRASDDWHAYAALAYRAEPFTVFGMTGQARPMAEAARAPAWTGAAYTLGAIGAALNNVGRVEQESLSAGLRWDITPQMAAKFQYDHFRIGDHGGTLWGDSDNTGRRANVVSIVIDSVF